MVFSPTASFKQIFQDSNFAQSIVDHEKSDLSNSKSKEFVSALKEFLRAKPHQSRNLIDPDGKILSGESCHEKFTVQLSEVASKLCKGEKVFGLKGENNFNILKLQTHSHQHFADQLGAKRTAEGEVLARIHDGKAQELNAKTDYHKRLCNVVQGPPGTASLSPSIQKFSYSLLYHIPKVSAQVGLAVKHFNLGMPPLSPDPFTVASLTISLGALTWYYKFKNQFKKFHWLLVGNEASLEFCGPK